MIVYPWGINETLPYLTSRMCDEMKPQLAHVHVVFVSLFKKTLFSHCQSSYIQPYSTCDFFVIHQFYFCLNLILIPTVVSRFR